jgi:hypothetical protein
MLEGMVNDGETAERVAGGDFADLSGGELTSAEQALLTAAAGDLDGDVSGFGSSFLKLGDIDGPFGYFSSSGNTHRLATMRSNSAPGTASSLLTW